MKLLMITGLGSVADLVSDKRGAFYNTLEEFHKHWDRIDIISPKIRGQKSGVKVLFGNVYVHISNWPLLLHPIWFIKKGVEIYKEQKFDLMTVQEYPPFYNGIGARLLWNKIRVPYVLEIFHIPGHPKAANFKEFFYKVLTKWFIKLDSSRAKKIRVMNKKEVSDFLIKAGVLEEKLMHIPAIYIDGNTFYSTNLDKKYDLIFIGRLETNKGVELFLETIRLLNCSAAIVGNGSLGDEIKSKIQKLKLKIDFYGWVKGPSDVAKLLNQSRVLIMASFNEGGPRVVVEAMACGVPVLATPVGIVSDIIKDKESGVVVDWNVNDISEKARLLLSDDSTYEKIKKAGLEISKNYEKSTSIRYYADKLKSLAK